MPVTFKVADHAASPIRLYRGPNTAESILKGAARNATENLQEVLQCSIHASDVPKIIPSPNGFVYTCIQAYNSHQNLVIRPDDIWMAILTQFSMYVNRHAEEMRSYFVAHEGKKELEVKSSGNRYTVDFGAMANRMGELLDVGPPQKTKVNY